MKTDAITLVDLINKLRLENKGKWYFFDDIINIGNKKIHVKLKGIDTWLQIFKIDGIQHFSGMDIAEWIYQLKSLNKT